MKSQRQVKSMQASLVVPYMALGEDTWVPHVNNFFAWTAEMHDIA